MSTTTLWDDNFSSYSPGPGHPTNWFDLGGNTQIVAFSTMTGSTQAPGFYEQTGHGLQLNGDQLYYIDTHTGIQSAQMVWLSFNGVYDISIFNINLATFTGAFPGQGQTILSCLLNRDDTMTLAVSSTLGSPVGVYPIAITTQQVAYPKCLADVAVEYRNWTNCHTRNKLSYRRRNVSFRRYSSLYWYSYYKYRYHYFIPWPALHQPV